MEDKKPKSAALSIAYGIRRRNKPVPPPEPVEALEEDDSLLEEELPAEEPAPLPRIEAVFRKVRGKLPR